MSNNPHAANAESSFATVFDDCKTSKLKLDRYLDQFALSNDDREGVVNFIRAGPIRPARFHIPDDDIPKMMSMLSDCYAEGVSNHYLEIQDVNHIKASALFFQFEFHTDEKKVEFNSVIQKFIDIVFKKILCEFIEFPNQKKEFVCMFMSPQDSEYNCETLKYESAFRIVIPGMLLESDVRFLVYEKIWQNKSIKDLFLEKLDIELRSSFKRNMRTAPVSLLQTCSTPTGTPWKLDSVYSIAVDCGKIKNEDGCYRIVNDLDTKFPDQIINASLNYQNGNRGIVRKQCYSPNSDCVKKMNLLFSKSTIVFQQECDNAYASFILQQVIDSEIKHIYDMIMMLSNERFRDLDEWTKVLKALASARGKYRCIAILMTKERAKALIKDGTIEWNTFVEQWDACVNSESRENHSIDAIRFWASCDQPSRFQRYNNKETRKMVENDIRDALVQGKISHSHLARYIYFNFQNVYMTSSEVRNSANWHEFVTPSTSDKIQGQLYKWRSCGSNPDRLLMYMSREFKDIASIVHNELRSICNEEYDGDDKLMKYAKDIQRNFKNAVQNVFTNPFKRSVISEATSWFKNDSFFDRMDKTAHIIGVGNGVLEFGDSGVNLVDHFHTYPISLYTTTEYVPYDENCEYVKTVYKMLRSLVPDDEMDALDFLLYYFSTSLDWYPKESLFFIIHGGGSNGKSVLLELFRLTLGMYARKMPLSFITDQGRTRSSSADPAIMELKNARLVYYSESDRNEKVNVAKVKEVTGGEAISGRQLYKEQENFRVNCNHIVTTNHRFVIETTEHAVWRRFISYKFKICFKHEIDPSKSNERLRDPDLINKIMKDTRYHSAFLSILIHYRSVLYSQYDGQILKVPHPTIIRETEEYRQSEDIFQRYIMQRVYYYKGVRQSMDDFANHFRNYYRIENADVYRGKTADLFYIFRNSCIGKYFEEKGGILTLDNFYTCADGESPTSGSVLFSEWIKQQ